MGGGGRTVLPGKWEICIYIFFFNYKKKIITGAVVLVWVSDFYNHGNYFSLKPSLL